MRVIPEPSERMSMLLKDLLKSFYDHSQMHWGFEMPVFDFLNNLGLVLGGPFVFSPSSFLSHLALFHSSILLSVFNLDLFHLSIKGNRSLQDFLQVGPDNFVIYS